ncbi:MAG TPA: hypothetical protein VGC22_09630, partial [Chitinophaga sp.]
MNRFFLYTAALLTAGLAYALPAPAMPGPAPAAGQPAALKCEYLVQPLGIDAPHPRLSWRLDDARNGALQTAYQVHVSTDSLLLGKKDVWNTGRITGSAVQVVYNGQPLLPFTRYYWSVELWDQQGRQTRTAIASFETGMMDPHNWQGAWISDHPNINLKPAGSFRKVFTA